MGFKVYLRNKKGKKENSAKKTSVKLPGFCCPRKACSLIWSRGDEPGSLRKHVKTCYIEPLLLKTE